MKTLIVVLMYLFLSNNVYSAANKPGIYYVAAKKLNVRIEPNSNSEIVRGLSKNTKVEVHEIKSGWARVSVYINSNSIKKTALWVSANYLSNNVTNKSDCKTLDSDISNSYSGVCKNGLAHGKGVAKGRDVYRGSFIKGDPHGFGIYEWGANSEWAGDRYEGEWKHGNRTGYGVYSSPSSYSDWPGFKANSEYKDGRYFVIGIFLNGAITHICNSSNDCREINDNQLAVSRSQLKKMARPYFIKFFEEHGLNDKDIPDKPRKELGNCLSDQMFEYFFDDEKLSYSEADLKDFKETISTKMLLLTFDMEKLFKNFEVCADAIVESTFKNIEFNSLLVSMDDYIYENVKIVANGLYLANMFVLRKNISSLNFMLVNIENIDDNKRIEVLDKCSDPLTGCQITIYGQVERGDFDLVLNAKKVKWQAN